MCWWCVSDKIAIRTESIPRRAGGPRIILVYKCAYDDCGKEIRVRKSDGSHSGFCKAHSHRLRPFESIYNGLGRDHRNISVHLSYEEFLEFTKIKNCTYCLQAIPWEPFGTVDGEFKSRAYFLDRKDHDGPYSKENCLVCCTLCNQRRRDWYTTEEFSALMKLLSAMRST